jgi:anti-sigma regulatory factor (Ser/Thr protein kinase)
VNENEVELTVSPHAPACARWYTRQAALKWNLPGLADTAELLCSELVTNAVQASDGAQGAVVKLWLVADSDSLTVAVWDSSDSLPVLQAPGPDDYSGRGLLIVDALSTHWGASQTFPGKVVYCHIREKGVYDV